MGNALAVVILSGGLDSGVALAIAVEKHGAENVHAISFVYGQKHHVEVGCAYNLAIHYGVNHESFPINADLLRGGVLTTEEEIPDMRYDDLESGVMSPTYVPFRNGTMIAMSAAYADTLLRSHEENDPGNDNFATAKWEDSLLYCGMHAEDGAGFAYADCTPEFLGAMAAAIHIGTYGRVRLHALFQHHTKAEIIEHGMMLAFPFEMSHSCYRGMRPACGACSTCHARQEAFAEAGYTDPLPYQTEES